MTLRLLREKSYVFVLVVFALVHFVTAISWAQSTIVSSKGPVTLTYAPGQPAVLKIDDDHEATVFVSYSEPLDLDINLDITENLCDPNYRKPTCVYSAGFCSDRIVLLWSKHSDPTKLGQKIKYKTADNTEGGFSEVEERLDTSSLDPYVNRKPDARFKPEKLTCDQYEWLGGQFANTASANKKLPDLRFKILSSERMDINDETGVNENRTLMMAENVLLRPIGESYQLTSVGRLIRAGSYIRNPSNFFFSGQLTTFQVMGPNPKQLCQVSLSYNILQAVKGRNPDENYNKKPNFKIFYDYTNPKFLGFTKSLQPILKPYAGAVLEFQ